MKSPHTLPADSVDRCMSRIEGLFAFDGQVEAIVDLVESLSKRFRRALEQTLAEHGLSLGEWKLLGAFVLGKVESPSSPGALAKELELSSGAMTNRLDRLEEAGLIRRLPDPHDRRGVGIELTDRGRELWTESTSAQARKEALVAGALTKAEQHELNGLLRKLMLAFELDAAGEGAAAEEPVGAVADARA